MAGPPAAMAAEDAFLAALRNVRAWNIINQTLELTDGEKPQLRFKAGPHSARTANP